MKPSVVRWWDPLAALVLGVSLFAVASRLTATRWTDNLGMAYSIALLGVAAGLALGQSRFPSHWAFAFAVAYGVFTLGWQVGLAFGEGVEWRERLFGLFGRLNVSLAQLVNQQAVQDPLLPVLLFAILFWVLSTQAGYALTRHADPWQATLPGALALLIINAYDPRPLGTTPTGLAWNLGIYFLAMLLLIARLGYIRQREQWRSERVHLSPEVGLDMARATALAALVLVVMAWVAPDPQGPVSPVKTLWTAAAQPWNAARSRVGNLFTSLQASFGIVDDTFSDRMSLGRGASLTDEAVMTVEAPGDPPPGVRFYWRAWAYDEYTGGQWRNSFTAVQSVTPDRFDFHFPEYRARWRATFAFTPAAPIAMLYAAPQPVWVSRPAQITVATGDDGSGDILSARAVVPVYPGETYRADGSFSMASRLQLRSAGSDYPQWIIDHYLQLPPLTERTQQLARDIAAPHDNAFDIADAVTDYLRANIQYAETIPAPPPDQDLIDWFLFDGRQGFCNYYATAEVLMLRSLGIPARMAVGYARGRLQAVNEVGPGIAEEIGRVTFAVLERDAHAWPEVYFPAYGWVEFEPTVSQAPITRPSGERLGPTEATPTPLPDSTPDAPEINLPDEIADSESADAGAGSVWIAVLWIGIPLGVVLIAVLVWQVRARANLPPLPVLMETGMRRMGFRPPLRLEQWARVSSLPPVERAYQEINNALRRLDELPPLSATPSERTAALATALPDVADSARTLLAEYHRAAYSPRGGNAAVAQEAGRAIFWASWEEVISRKINGRRGV